MKKYAYKIELPIQWKIHNVFYISLLEQNTTKKWQVNKLLESNPELHTTNNKEYKLEAIRDNAVYVNKVVGGQLSGLYYLVS